MDDRIITLETRDVRFPLPEGAGSDAVHSGSDYAFATTLLITEAKKFGTGIVLTLGNGNELVCRAIKMLAGEVIGRDVEELMSSFGEMLQATNSDANLLVLFIPSADREGDSLGKKEQKRWVRKALKLLG